MALVTASLACDALESTDGTPSRTSGASVAESAARVPIDLGAKRETALFEAFYPAPLAEDPAAVKTVGD